MPACTFCCEVFSSRRTRGEAHIYALLALIIIASATSNNADGQTPGALPGELPMRLPPGGFELLWPDRFPAVAEIADLAADLNVRTLAVIRLHADQNNHYAPTWASDGQAIAFLRSDLSAHTSKALVIDFEREHSPRILYDEFLSYEHMTQWNLGGGRILAFSSNNEDQRFENIHVTSDAGSECHALTAGPGTKILPSLFQDRGVLRLVYRQDAELLETSYATPAWNHLRQIALGDAEEAVFAPDGSKLAVVRPIGGGHIGHDLRIRDCNTRHEVSVFAVKERHVRNPVFSPNGQKVAFFSRLDTKSEWELWVLSVGNNSSPQRLATSVRVQEDFRQVGPAWGALSNRLWYFASEGDQGYHPAMWVSLDGQSRGQVDYPRRLTTAMDLSSTTEPSFPALAFVAVEQHALDVIVILLNQP